jgi:crotonobetainyl-CoA:carnitine CoA-transferase CaiB-like acyl-CoA transferase
VLVTGYRPGALRKFGLDPEQVAERHPGTVVVTLSAWGTTGPWGTRRGFDSLVQVATGIGWLTRAADGRPGALPCQLLDHATGYLAAAGALAALATRERTGVAAHVEVSLARTARWLLDTPLDASPPVDTPTAPFLVPLGAGWTGVSPPGALDGVPLTWPHLPPAYGRSPAAWT